MKSCKSSPLKSTSVVMTCIRCSMSYCDYKRLLEHLYWRHGTESFWCKQCGLKRWHHAVHLCHVLPIEDIEDVDANSDDSEDYSQRETDFCFCGKYIAQAPMIGCDGPQCVLQWYHFACVGIESPPDGDWLCPECETMDKSQKKQLQERLKS